MIPSTEQLTARKQLHDLLLDQSKWPEGFTWNFFNPVQCGMGLARKTEMYEHNTVEFFERGLGLSSDQWVQIFSVQLAEDIGVTPHDITPTHVAAALAAQGLFHA